MIKRLLLLTAIFGFAVSCNDYEDDFANLNDQLDGVDAKLDNIQSTVDGIADIQLELLNINSALAAIASSIGELPTVQDIANLSTLVSETSASLSAQMNDLDSDLQAVAATIIAQLDDMEDMIENGFLAVNASLDALKTNIQVIDGEIEILQTSVDANGNKIDANGNAIIDLAGAVAVVDGKIVAVDGKLDDVLNNLTGQLADMLDSIIDQFDTVNDNAESNASDAFLWYTNTMNSLGDLDVRLDNIDDDNSEILQQLQQMLEFITDEFDDQNSELSDMEQRILAQITSAQTQIGENLLKINALNDLVVILTQNVSDNNNSVNNQLAAIKELIELLQSDVDTLLENITTVYNGDLNITNDAELTYALTLKDKVAVVNGSVYIKSDFATGAQAESLISVMNKFNTVTGSVEIESSLVDMSANSLRSVGGNYKVKGLPVLTPAFVNAANDVTLHYSDDENYVTSFVNIGGKLEIRSNNASVVDFSNVEGVGSFSIIASDLTLVPLLETNILYNPDFVDLGSISESDLAGTPSNNPFFVVYTAAATDPVSLFTGTNLVVVGSDFDNVTLEGNNVELNATDITGNILAVADGYLNVFANDITNTSNLLSSDGQFIGVNDVTTTSFSIVDTGSTPARYTDMRYSSVTATSFTLDSSTPGANNFLIADSATSAWTVDQTTMTLNKSIVWYNYTEQDPGNNSNIGHPIDGNVSIAVENGGSTIISGLIDGDVDVQTNGNNTLTTINNGNTTTPLPDGTSEWVWSLVGKATLTSNTGNVTINHKQDDNSDDTRALSVLPNSGVELGERNLTATAGNITRRAGDNQSGPFNLLAGQGITFQGPAGPSLGGLNITGFTTTADFQQLGTVFTDIDVVGSGKLLGANLDGASYGPYSLNISADAGIILTGFDQIGLNVDGVLISSVLTSTTGDIDISNVVTINNDASISSTDGDINASSLTTAAGVVSIAASGAGNVDTRLLSTHDGSSLTVGGTLIMVESLVSSTGDLTLNGDLVQADLTADEASPLLATWNTLTVGSDTLVELPVHDDENAGAMTLTLAQTVSTNSITIAEVSAPAMTSLELTAQSTSFALVNGDFDNAAVDYTIDISGDASLDAMSFTGVSNLIGLTTAGNVDTFVAAGNANLATISAGHVNVTGAAANPLGTKLHLIDNTSLLGYVSSTNKMHEIIITGNTALADLDLTSYLSAIDADNDGVNDATVDDTAFDGGGVDFIFNVTNNGLEGVFAPKANTLTPDTSLESDDLVDSGVKAIALHLLAFEQANSVVAVADFLNLTDDGDAADQFNTDTDFTNGIGVATATTGASDRVESIAEFTLLANETP